MGRRKKSKFIFQNISTFWNIFAHCAYVASTEWSTVWKLHTLVVSFRLSCPTFYFKFIKLCTLCQLKILLHLLSFWFVSFFKKIFHSFILNLLFVCFEKKKLVYISSSRSCWKKITNQWFVNHVAQCPFRAQVRVIFEKKPKNFFSINIPFPILSFFYPHSVLCMNFAFSSCMYFLFLTLESIFICST